MTLTITLWLAIAFPQSYRPSVVLERFTDKQACLAFVASYNADHYKAACYPADKVYVK